MRNLVQKHVVKTTIRHSSQLSSFIINRGGQGVVVLELDDQRYSIPLENVVEIIRMVAITTIPEAGNAIEGIINLRGNIVPVVDLRKCLGINAKPYNLNTHIIIAQLGEHVIGLVVDCVINVMGVPDTDLSPSKQIAPSSKYVLGVAKTEDGLLLALDMGSIFKQMVGDLSKVMH